MNTLDASSERISSPIFTITHIGANQGEASCPRSWWNRSLWTNKRSDRELHSTTHGYIDVRYYKPLLRGRKINWPFLLYYWPLLLLSPIRCYSTLRLLVVILLSKEALSVSRGRQTVGCLEVPHEMALICQSDAERNLFNA